MGTLLMAVILLLGQLSVQCTANDLQIDWSKFASEIDSIQCKGPNQTWTCAGLFPLSAADADADRPWNRSLVMAPNDMDDYQFIGACHCDDQCVEYGDCCRDASVHWAATEPSRSYWQCLPLTLTKNNLAPNSNTVQFNNWNIYMVGRCPISDGQLAAMCHRHPVDDEHYTYMLDVPVHSLTTNVTYANIFCAQCHQDAGQLAAWDAAINCNIDYYEPFDTVAIINDTKKILSKLTYIKGERRWQLTKHSLAPEWKEATCSLSIQQFIDARAYIRARNGRRCIQRIESCATWASAVDIFKCLSYTRYMQTSTSGHAYKNPHCALCNDDTQHSTLDCYELNPNQYRSRLPVGPRLGGPTHSMSLIFDFTLGAGGGPVGQQRHCQDHEFWDHVHQQCHALHCTDFFEQRGSACVPKQVDQTQCPLIELTESDFYLKDDDLLVLNTSGAIYNRSQYQVDANGTVFICALDDDYDFKYSEAQDYLSTVCLSISVVCLAVHITIHLLVPKLRNLPGKNLLSLSCALFGAQLLFLTGVRETQLEHLCTLLAALTHWFFLAAFFWMNIMGVDICRTFSSRLHHTGSRQLTFGHYSLYAWGCPTLIVTGAMVVHLTSPHSILSPRYGANVCWISNRTALAVWFALPVALLLLANTGLFIGTVCSILRQKRSAKFAANQSYKSQSEPSSELMAKRRDLKRRKHNIRLVLYVKLALIMGLGWLFAFLASLTQVQALWYPFILLNGLQGLFILVAFDLKTKIYHLLWQRIIGQPHPDVSRTTSKASSSISYLVRSSIVTGGDIAAHHGQSLLPSPSIR